MVAKYDGTPIDTVSWCVGNSEVYQYETHVGERTGAAYHTAGFTVDQLVAAVAVDKTHSARRAPPDLDALRALSAYHGISQMEANGAGPLTSAVTQFAQHGIKCFPGLRMNSHYAVQPGESTRLAIGPLRRQHPEWLITKPHEHWPAPTVENSIGGGVDYACPEVRSHYLDIVTELLSFDGVVGIELDFYRHPAFFRVDEAFTNRYLMNDFVRRCRAAADEAAQKRSSSGGGGDSARLEILVRVPGSLQAGLSIGLDVATWMQQGWVDTVAVGGGFDAFEAPVGEFVELARGTPCQVLGGLEALRWTLDENVIYALAARFRALGADGVYLFNYFNTTAEWKQRVFGTVVDPERLSCSDKQIELEHHDRASDREGHSASFRLARCNVSLPVQLEETLPGGGAAFTLAVHDDIDSNGGKALLELGVSDLADGDHLEVEVAGTVLPWASFTHERKNWSATIFSYPNGIYHEDMEQSEEPPYGPEIAEVRSVHSCALPSGTIQRGQNEVRIRVTKASGLARLRPIVLRELKLHIKYGL